MGRGNHGSRPVGGVPGVSGAEHAAFDGDDEGGPGAVRGSGDRPAVGAAGAGGGVRGAAVARCAGARGSGSPGGAGAGAGRVVGTREGDRIRRAHGDGGGAGGGGGAGRWRGGGRGGGREPGAVEAGGGTGGGTGGWVAGQGAAGTRWTRTVMLAKGRTVLVTAAAADGGSPVQPSLEGTGKNAAGYQEYRRVRDGATMVEIPEGEFLMGNLETEGAPQPHTVYVSSFLMDKLPLTVGLYKRFAAATGRALPPDPYWGVEDDYTVAFVRWDEGKAYCEWAGGRLPTEAEREKATRGTDGRTFPWGSDPPSDERAVYGRYWGELGNDKVGARPAGAGPYGLLDSEGNMWEFCEDWWDPDYYKSSAPKDPRGPKTGQSRVVRGGSWDSRWVTLKAARRN